jgi:hypothetical protein
MVGGWIERQHAASSFPLVLWFRAYQMVGSLRGILASPTTAVAAFVMSPVDVRMLRPKQAAVVQD